MKKIFFILFFIPHLAYCGSIDSLVALFNSSKDTLMIQTALAISKEYKSIGEYPKAAEYAEKALSLSSAIGYQKGRADAFNQSGGVYLAKGEYSRGRDLLKQALEGYTALSDRFGMGSAMMSIGSSYDSQGNYPAALKQYMDALKIFEELKNHRYIAMLYVNIGTVHQSQKNDKKAIEYYIKSLQISEPLGLKELMAQPYGNIAVIYLNQKKYQEALEYHKKSLAIAEEINNIGSIIAGNYNIGIVLDEMKDDEAMVYFNKVLKMGYDLGDAYTQAAALVAIGSFKEKRGLYRAALDSLIKGALLAKSIGVKEYMSDAYKSISNCYHQLNNDSEALKYYQFYSSVRDSLINETSNRNIQEMQAIYETEKKDNEIALLNKEKQAQAEISDAKNRQKNTVIYSVIAGLFIVTVFSIFLFKKFRVVRSQNIIIARQKKQVEDKNKEIIDSINYAKRIQQIMLPSEKSIDKMMKRCMLS